ncbi:MAG: DNA primase [Micrococcales bacterium]
MAGKIRARDIEEVKARVNIADVVSDYVALKPAGVGSLKGLCPFHDEKSPSFTVKPNDGFYKCFGCGEGGDVYKFLQQLESISFYEAVEKLASRVGFALTYEEGSGQPSDYGLRNRIFEANQAAAIFYQSQIMSDGAEAGREFLKGRGFDRAAAEHFGIGFAPKAWSELYNHLKGLGFSDDELVSAALVTKGDKGFYDKFRGRLMWPIKDSTGQVIGFGARKLFEDDNGPKYLNSSDTLVYHKSQVLYGIDLAKKEITKKQQVVVVEGYTDVMACHLAGITTAVATCGTAFGDDHIRILNRMLSNEIDSPAEVIFTFDPDAAGQKAAMRAYNDSNKFNAQTFVAVGPDGLDPCDLRSARGDEAVVDMIATKKPIFEFAIKQKISKFDLNSVEGRVAAARAAAPVIAGIRDAALRPAYVRALAGWVSLDGNEVASLVDVALKKGRNDAVAELRRDQQIPEAPEIDPGAEPSHYPAINLSDPIMRFERQLLEVLLQIPNAYTTEQLKRIVAVAFSAPTHIAIANAIEAAAAWHGKTEFLPTVAGATPADLQGVLLEIAGQTLPANTEEQLQRYGEGVVSRGIAAVLAREKNELLAALRRTEQATEPEAYAEIQRKLVALEAERRTVQG